MRVFRSNRAIVVSDHQAPRARRWPGHYYRAALLLAVILSLYPLTLFGPLSTPLLKAVETIYPVPVLGGKPRGTLLYAANGEKLQLVNPDRVRVMPMRVRPSHRNIRLFLRYEDEAFFRHRGVDPQAIARALYHSATHCRPHHCHIVSGASTITMQLVKLLHPRPRTWLNKAIEAIEARLLELHHDKSTLLEAYLNRIPLPEGMRGINTGALRYFGKDFYQLELHELALLSAMPQAPARMNPLAYPDNARRQRNKLLARWLAYGEITRTEHDTARKQPLGAARHPFPFDAPHYGFRIALRSENHAARALETAIAPQLQATMANELSTIADQHDVTAAGAVFDHRLDDFIAYHGSHRYTDYQRHGNVDQLFRRLLPCRLVTTALLDTSTTCTDHGAIGPLRDVSLSLREPVRPAPLNAAQLLRAIAATGGPLRCPSPADRADAFCQLRQAGDMRILQLRTDTYTAVLTRNGFRSGVLLLTQPWISACRHCPQDERRLRTLEDRLVSWTKSERDAAP